MTREWRPTAPLTGLNRLMEDNEEIEDVSQGESGDKRVLCYAPSFYVEIGKWSDVHRQGIEPTFFQSFPGGDA